MRPQKRPASEIAKARKLKAATYDPVTLSVLIVTFSVSAYALVVSMVAYTLSTTSSATTDAALQIEAHAVIINWIASLFQ